MTADRDSGATTAQRGHTPVGHREPKDLVRCGAELVGLSERFYGFVFVGGVLFVGAASLAALTVLLLGVHAFEPGDPVAAAHVVTALIVAATPLAVWRSRSLYYALRRRHPLRLALVAVAATLIVHPAMSGELWWPSCAILMGLAIVATLPHALLYCLFVLGANLAGHVVAGDLDEVDPVAVIGLWIGYPLWVGTIAIVTDSFAAHILRWRAMQAREATDERPRRVPAWTTPPSPDGEADDPAGADLRPRPAGRRRAPPPARGSEDRTADRLTARQLQVIALLADGLRHREIADCLAISQRQVQRHIADAVERLGLRNAYELAAYAVSEDIVPAPPAAAAPRDRRG